ncbi:MAG TPA: neutral/alkaline non-lysosomal ceramidase N-terminal domain-containing protein [Draconibacterium sp.]|nr:neutral/alkaline non-lysosomal ceramidase N-terminal domain-containing protein [Draconibacterium sp.]
MKLINQFFYTVILFLAVLISKGERITANVSSIDITPPLEMKYTLGGYGERMNKPAEGIHDAILAKALVLKNGDTKYAIITIDILGLPSNVKPDLLKRIAAKGWSAENLMLLPSHSHGSLEMAAINSKNVFGVPQIGIFQPELLSFLLDKLEKLVLEADQNYREVKIGTSSAKFDGLNRNRRGDKFVDNKLTVTRIDLVNGQPLSALVNWTAHPTFISGDDMLVSAEWPGYLQTEMEKTIGKGVVVMYYNGAEGDQSTVYSGKGGAYEKIQDYGKIIAENAMSVYNSVQTKKENTLDYSYKVIDLPEQVAHPDFMETGGAEYGLNEESVKVIMDALGPKNVGIGSVRVGDFVLVGIPGELVAELGVKIKDSLKNDKVKHVAIGGLANEWISYILTEEEYVNGGGYESSVSFYGPKLGEIITGSAITISESITKSK